MNWLDWFLLNIMGQVDQLYSFSFFRLAWSDSLLKQRNKSGEQWGKITLKHKINTETH